MSVWRKDGCFRVKGDHRFFAGYVFEEVVEIGDEPVEATMVLREGADGMEVAAR